MNPEDQPKKCRRRRSPAKDARTKKIEIRLTESEFERTRQNFGRQAATVARACWLGFRTGNPTTPDKEKQLKVAASLLSYRMEVEKLRHLVREGYGEQSADLLKLEEEKFNFLAHLWLSIFSTPPSKMPSPEE